MTNRPPLPGTYDPKDWKCPKCKTLNFKKRMSCLSCACAKPRGEVEPIKDWRAGKKDVSENVHADWTCRQCGQFNLAMDKTCKKCQGPCPPKTVNLVVQESGDARSGRGSGHFDRPDPEEERNRWNSDDEEIDEFGRKKRKTRADSAGSATAKRHTGTSAADRQKAALERLRSKTAGGGRRAASKSRSPRR
mmetsp:Transcript_130285/g.324881  ORF Transcript_130285/g.324881 Transcript_130285/m.324881 type:complete len:191 (-) Transcript_130285:215-787(-)